jgi:hypothetical protein
MMINFERLDNLKLMLSREEDLATIWSYFMTHLADHEAFTDIGEPIRHPLVEKIIIIINQQLFDETVKNLLLISLPNFKFLHGVFTVGNRTGGVIYFEEIQKGMVAVSENPPSQLVKYSRFTPQLIGSSNNLN